MADLEPDDIIKIECFRIRKRETIFLLPDQYHALEGVAIPIDIFANPVPVGYYYEYCFNPEVIRPPVDIF